MDEVLWKGLDVLTDGQDITGLRKMVLVSFMRRHFQMEEAIVGSDALSALLAKLPSQELSAVADIVKGKTGIKDAKPGPYPLVVTAEARGECDHFDYEGPSVLIPMVSSTGHGDASLKRIHYQEGRYAVGSILAVVRPLDPGQLSARYLYEYLSAFKDELLVSRMVGTANVSLTVKKLGDVPVPLIPMESQNQIERLMALCDRLEADQADAEAAHAQLVQALLDSLTQATDAADFRASWQRLSEHLHTLFTTEASIDALKQAVLQLAVMGKIVKQDLSLTEDGLAAIGKIIAWRKRAVISKEIREPRNPVKAIGTDEHPYKLPDGWAWVRLGTLIYIQSGDGLTAANMRAGTIPVFGGNGINGYHDESNVASRTLVIGRVGYYCGSIHVTPENAWVTDNAFVTKFCADAVDIRFLYWLLKITNLKENDSATAQPVISGSKIYPIVVGLPPLEEQHRIVAKVDELMALCDQLKAQLATARQQHAQLASVLVAQAVA